MPDPNEPLTAASILKQSEPIKAMFESFGQALADAHRAMIQGGMSEDVADAIAKDLGHQFAQGTFNKVEGIQFPQIGGFE